MMMWWRAVFIKMILLSIYGDSPDENVQHMRMFLESPLAGQVVVVVVVQTLYAKGDNQSPCVLLLSTSGEI